MSKAAKLSQMDFIADAREKAIEADRRDDHRRKQEFDTLK